MRPTANKKTKITVAKRTSSSRTSKTGKITLVKDEGLKRCEGFFIG
jgi:hypothetical protein